MFFRFIRACKKYKFTFALSTYGGLTLVLRPNDTFENIKFDEGYCYNGYHRLFKKAIKEMKEYRKKNK